MTNDELDKAIDTACRHCVTTYGRGETEEIMMTHLKKLLAEQERRLDEEKPEPEPVAWVTEAAWGTSVAFEKPDFGEAEWKAPTPKVIPLYRKDQL